MDNNSLAVVNSPTPLSRHNSDGCPFPCPRPCPDDTEITRNDFPPKFIFGVGTAAYQNEGGAATGGRGPSVWDSFTLESPAHISDGSNGNVATDMYARYKEDIKMMKKMGLDAYRFSISWSRILPGGRCCAGINREGIDYYNELIDTIIRCGLKPYVTLFHWDLPHCLQEEYGGFMNKNHVVNDFREFAELCFWEFGDRVKHWMTLNEPWTYAVYGYATRSFPPGREGPTPKHLLTALCPPDLDSTSAPTPPDFPSTPPLHHPAFGSLPRSASANFGNVDRGVNVITYRGVFESPHLLTTYQSSSTRMLSSKPEHRESPRDAYVVGRNLLLAHSAAAQAYRDNFKKKQGGQIGIATCIHWFEPYNECDEDDRRAADRAHDFMLGWFLEPLLSGNYPQSMLDYVPPEHLALFSPHESEMLKGSIDFVGLNYYTARYAQNDPCSCGDEDGYFKDQQVRFYQSRDGVPIGPAPGSPWLNIVPWGIRKLLLHVKKTYKNLPPIYITENGMSEKTDCKKTACQACPDRIRVHYYKHHLKNLRQAMWEGPVDVRGYFAWSWCDNFEWLEGYTVRFGLIYVDYMNNLTRYMKHSAMWFTKFLTKDHLITVPNKKRQITDGDDNEQEKRLKAMEE